MFFRKSLDAHGKNKFPDFGRNRPTTAFRASAGQNVDGLALSSSRGSQILLRRAGVVGVQ